MARRPSQTLRTKRLLSAGMLPEELPPPFVSHPLGRYRASLARSWAAAPTFGTFRSRSEPFSIPRTGAPRRRAVIVNPINHFRLSSLISENWQEIRDHISQSEVTEFRPIFDTDGDRALFGIDFEKIDRRKAEILSSYNRAYQTDITRFYASIYTHSIAWALYTKDWVKANRFGALRGTLGDRLDAEARRGQEDQTVGIPIGPDTSRILSEIIAVGMERELERRLGTINSRAVRYVDDLIIGFDDFESEERVAAALEGAMSHYELDLNLSKTAILGVESDEGVDWISELRACGRISFGVAQRHDLERFFKLALHFASTADKKDAVLKWALKRARSFAISDQNYAFFCDWIIRCARKAKACLPVAVQILIEARSDGRELPLNRISKFVNDVLLFHAPVGHAFEVAWALFLAKGLRLEISEEGIAPVLTMESSACALIAMDLNRRGLVRAGFSDAQWLTYGHEDGLTSSMWLLAYEAAKKGWWSDGRRTYATAHPLFGPMIARGVYFYDEHRNVPRARTDIRRARVQSLRTHMIMSRWSEYF